MTTLGKYHLLPTSVCFFVYCLVNTGTLCYSLLHPPLLDGAWQTVGAQYMLVGYINGERMEKRGWAVTRQEGAVGVTVRAGEGGVQLRQFP